MEHNLHVLLTICGLFGLALLHRSGTAPNWLPAILALGPLVRYEGASLTLIGVALLWFAGERRHAIAAASLCAISLVGFSLFLLSQGLEVLPSSVLVRLDERPEYQAGLLSSAVQYIHHKLSDSNHHHAFTAACAVIGIALVRRRWLWLAAVAFTLFTLHLLMVKWYFRYVPYLLTVLLPALAVLLAPPLVHVARKRGFLIAGLTALLVSGPVLFIGTQQLIKVTVAARNIYSQQFQMHRFVVDYYKQPVAVNDLGWVSYRNNQYVLDLWGLGSEEARTARAESKPGWSERLLSRHNVKLMMIYEHWLEEAIPDSWVLIGSLTLGRRAIGPAGEKVAFYAHPQAASEIEDVLHRFAPTLPPGAGFEFSRH